MSVADQNTRLPGTETTDLARASATELSRYLSEHPEAERARVQFNETHMVLPRHALELLRDLLAEMAQGNAVTIVPTHAELTTQQAADILNVSRPHLIKLLESGEIPFSHVGTHRRIRYQDLMAYKAERDRKSEEAMDELARQAQENDMGY